MTRIASVFGSARAAPGDRAHEDALIVGRGLAAAGWAVMTGGYSGVMDAASRGAREGGGEAIGITVAGWHNAPSRWLSQEYPAASLFARLDVLTRADALVAVGGGVGTLAEVAVAWNRRQKGDDRDAPLILVGERWAVVFDTLVRELGLGDDDRRHVRLAASAVEVVALLGVA